MHSFILLLPHSFLMQNTTIAPHDRVLYSQFRRSDYFHFPDRLSKAFARSTFVGKLRLWGSINNHFRGPIYWTRPSCFDVSYELTLCLPAQSANAYCQISNIIYLCWLEVRISIWVEVLRFYDWPLLLCGGGGARGINKRFFRARDYVWSFHFLWKYLDYNLMDLYKRSGKFEIS